VPISDAYIVQFLVDGTSDVSSEIHWHEKDAEQAGYVTRIGDVDIILEPVYSRAGSQMVLRFRHDGEEFCINAPNFSGWLGRNFSTEDERVLTGLFRELVADVASQCASRRHRAAQNPEEIRERVGRRLLFGAIASGSNVEKIDRLPDPLDRRVRL
jgi:hypothetical protein